MVHFGSIRVVYLVQGVSETGILICLPYLSNLLKLVSIVF